MSILDNKESVMSHLNEKDNELYRNDEQELIELSKQVRKDMVINMIKDGIPNRSGDIRVLNEVLSSMDSQINNLATNRLRIKTEENNADNVALTAELIRTLRTKRDSLPVNRSSKILDDGYVPNDIVPGETDINPTRLSLDEFED